MPPRTERAIPQLSSGNSEGRTDARGSPTPCLTSGLAAAAFANCVDEMPIVFTIVGNVRPAARFASAPPHRAFPARTRR